MVIFKIVPRKRRDKINCQNRSVRYSKIRNTTLSAVIMDVIKKSIIFNMVPMKLWHKSKCKNKSVRYCKKTSNRRSEALILIIMLHCVGLLIHQVLVLVIYKVVHMIDFIYKRDLTDEIILQFSITDTSFFNKKHLNMQLYK